MKVTCECGHVFDKSFEQMVKEDDFVGEWVTHGHLPNHIVLTCTICKISLKSGPEFSSNPAESYNRDVEFAKLHEMCTANAN